VRSNPNPVPLWFCFFALGSALTQLNGFGGQSKAGAVSTKFAFKTAT
jgi:hypothetical protein